MFVLLVAALTGCKDPVESCAQAPRSDCCISDVECLDFYGSEAPFCAVPGRATGTCSECVRDSDCVGDEVCDFDADDFGICL